MHIKKPEDLRLRESKGVPDCAWLERSRRRQFDDELHAHCPLALLMASRHPEMFVERLPDWTKRTISDDCQSRAHIHPGDESCFWRTVLIHALVRKTNTN